MQARIVKTGEVSYILDADKEMEVDKQTTFIFRYPNAYEKAHIVEEVGKLISDNGGSFGQKAGMFITQMLLSKVLNLLTEDGKEIEVERESIPTKGFHLVKSNVMDAIGLDNWVELGLFGSTLLGLDDTQKKS